jgi:16S rRNA processing protein RimM
VPQSPEPWVWLARIRRPQGRKGEVFAAILTDFPEKFAERRKLWLLAARVKLGAPGLDSENWDASSLPPPREAELTNHWLHKDGIVLHFAGVDSISAAETLKGMIVAIPRQERAPLSEGEAYLSDLVGCALVNVAGPAAMEIGTIEDVDRSAGAAPLLVVRGAMGEVMVPFAKSYLRKIDLDGKRVEMALPEGLVDLNAAEGG